MNRNPAKTEPGLWAGDPFQRFFMSIAYAMILLGSIGILGNIMRAIRFGVDFYSILQWILYLSILVFLLFQKRIPFRVLLLLFIVCVWLIGAVGLLRWGILGSADILFTAIILVVGISLDKKKVLLLTALTLLLYVLVSSLIVKGVFHPNYDPTVYSTSLQGWLTTVLTFLALIGALADRTGWMFREIDISSSKIEAQNENILEEIMRREETQKTLENMIPKKEALLRNVHHQVKSNLQIISGIISVQAGISSNPDVKRITKTTEGRIQSMAVIHEILYQSEDLSEMNLKNLLEILCMNIERAFGLKEKNIALSTSLEEVVLGIENTVPFALIINEVINNSIIHGFSELPEGGEIKVALSVKDDREIHAEISDNGKGIGNSLKHRTSPGMGYDIINIITEEMEARYEVFDDNGTVFRIRFSI